MTPLQILIEKLQSYVYTNGAGLVTGAKLQEVLIDIATYAFHTDNFASDVRSIVVQNEMDTDTDQKSPSVTALKNFLVFSYLVDNLTTQDTSKALSAKQGYELKQLIDTLNSDLSALIVDDITTGGTDKALSAQQGVYLKSLIDGIQTILNSDNINLDTIQEFVDAIENVQEWMATIIIDDLISGGVMKALSAEQGKILKILVDTKASTGDLSSVQSYLEGLITNLQNDKINYSDVVDNLTTNSQMPLSANQGLILKGLIDGIQTILGSDNINLDTVQELVDAIETIQTSLSTILVDDLISGGVTKALTAEQGKVLKNLIDALTTVVNSKEDSSNKVTTFTGNEASTTKFPVVKAVIDYFTQSRLLSILGIPSLSGTNTGDQTITLTGDVAGTGTGSFAATIQAGAVSNSKMANMSPLRIKGRMSGGAGAPEDITGTQVTTILDVFTSSLQGLVPPSGGGTVNYLGASGWANPLPTVSEVSSTSSTTTTSTTDVQLNSITTTPAAGTYLAMFSGRASMNVAGGSVTVSLYVDGVLVSTSSRLRNNDSAVGSIILQGPLVFQEKITVNGSQVVECRWKVSGGTGTFNERKLSLLKCQ